MKAPKSDYFFFIPLRIVFSLKFKIQDSYSSYLFSLSRILWRNPTQENICLKPHVFWSELDHILQLLLTEYSRKDSLQARKKRKCQCNMIMLFCLRVYLGYFKLHIIPGHNGICKSKYPEWTPSHIEQVHPFLSPYSGCTKKAPFHFQVNTWTCLSCR